MDKIITVIGLPGAGKSSYCKAKAEKSHTWYRPEPTDDLANLRSRLCESEVNNLILDRFNLIDSTDKSRYRDSDYWTCRYIFGGMSILSGYVAPVSDELHLIYVTKAQQIANIKKRNRPFAEQESRYCAYHWHKRLFEAFRKHPAKVKRCFVPGSKPFTWAEFTHWNRVPPLV